MGPVDDGSYWVYAAPYWYVWRRDLEAEERAQQQRIAESQREQREIREEEERQRIRTQYGDEKEARRLARMLVLEALRYPYDAELDPGWFNGPSTIRVAQTWTVVGTVKAPNSFGAALTETYECRFFFNRSTGKYELEYFRIGNDVIVEGE